MCVSAFIAESASAEDVVSTGCVRRRRLNIAASKSAKEMLSCGEWSVPYVVE